MKKQKKLNSYTFAAAVFLLIVVSLLIFEITNEKYPTYGASNNNSNSSSSLNGSASTTINNNTNNTASLPADFNFAAVGDWGCTSNTNMTVNNILNKNPELVLALGDYSYNITSDDCWFKLVHPLDAKMKIAIGNHDYRVAGELQNYMNHFGLKQQYYSFDYQRVHFLAISSEIPYNATSVQYEFVKNDLPKAASNPNIDWIIVYFHRPMYTSPSTHPPSPVLRNTYHPLFEQYGVDLVLQGHNHNYQRTYPIIINNSSPSNPIETSTNTTSYTDPDGQIFATVGTGGRNIDSLNGKKDYVINQYQGFGILNVDITNNGRLLTGKFYANNGTIVDQFTLTKSIPTTK
jgi:predicted phosphodiesterase